jgi:hypothetical protein
MAGVASALEQEGRGVPESSDDQRAAARAAIEAALADTELEVERPSDDHYVVTMPGTHKLRVTCSLVVGTHTLSVNAFVVRHADENHEAVYRWLLERNARMYGVCFALDRLGDVYLVGRIALAAVTAEEIDRLLGAVLEHADGSFDALLELGFAGAIRREWAWRVKRGESLRNLEAFAGLVERAERAERDAGAAADVG